MKLLLSLMLVLSTPALAAEEYSFITPSGGELRFHHKTLTRSIQNKQVVISGYWSLITSDKNLVRSKVDVTGCEQNSGTVTNTMIGYDKVIYNVWVGDGLTVYDHVAETQCIFWNALSNKMK